MSGNNRMIHLGAVLLLSFALVGVALGAARQTRAEVMAQSGASEPQLVQAGPSGLAVPRILLVDDDDNAPDSMPVYVQALNYLGYLYDAWETGNTDNEPSLSFLAQYDAVIWFTGDSNGAFAGPSPASETSLASWLEGEGGCLFVSSQDYFANRGLTPFMQNYLGVQTVNNNVNQMMATGLNAYIGLGPYSLNYPPYINASDSFATTPSGVVSFQGSTGNAGVSQSNGYYQTTFLGFPFETLGFGRYDVIGRFLRNCFLDDILLVDDDDNSPDALSFYTTTLSNLGYYYQVWDTDNSDVEPTDIDLIGYDAVVWFTGDSYGGTAGPGAQGELALTNWLNTAQGCFFLSSQDYFYDRGLTPFMLNYLGLAGGSSDVAQTIVTGTQRYAGLGPFSLTYPISMSNFSDVFTPTIDAHVAFIGNQAVYSGGGNLLSTSKGVIQVAPLGSDHLSYATGLYKANGNYFTTWLGFPFEAIPTQIARDRTMHRFLANCFETDLAVHKYASAQNVQVGDTFTYTLEINNFGPNRAMDIIVSDFIPNEVVVQNIILGQASCSTTPAGDLLCNIPQLDVGEYQLIDVVVTALQPGGTTNFIFATNLGADPFPANNSTSRFVRILPPGFTAPIVDQVLPPVSSILSDTNLTIRGANFVPQTRVFVGNTEILSRTVVNDSTINATIPAGTLPKGDYEVRVLNPNDETASLPRGLSFYDSSALMIAEVFPAHGLNDRPNTINILGDGFSPGMTGKLVDAFNPPFYVVFESLQYISPYLVRAEVPYELPPGLYDVVLHNPENISATLPSAYTAIDGFTADDLFALNYDIFTIPATPREGNTIEIGLNVRRLTGPLAPAYTQTVTVDVSFSIAPAGGLAPLATTNVTGVITANTTISLTFPYTVGVAGDYVLTVDISSPDLSPDTMPANNVLTRTLTVLPPSSDSIPPQIASVTVNGGSLTTNQTNVLVSADASDVGTGLAYIYYIEYAYNRGLGDWEPVASSGWQPYDQASTDYAWTIHPVPGMHFIQAWVSDVAGNVSQPKVGWINFTPAKNLIVHDGGQVFRIPLAMGEAIQINLTSLTGDADMYIWDHDGSLVAYANSFTPLEEIIFIAPEDGIYQVDVYGHETTSYWFEITPMGFMRGLDEVQGHVKGGDRPLQVVQNEPGSDMNVPYPPSGSSIFLPVIKR